MAGRAVSVALPLPVQTAFTYAVPEGMGAPGRGVRVLVPFGRRRVIGVVTGEATAAPGLELRDVVDVLDDSPLASPPLLDLAAWIAEHYLAPPGECYRLVLPPAGVRASRAVARLADTGAAGGDMVVEALRAGPLRVSTLAKRLGVDPSARLARLRKAGVVAVDQDLTAPGFRLVQAAVLLRDDGGTRGGAQAEVVARLRKQGGRMSVADLVRDKPSLRGAVGRLASKGILRLDEEQAIRSPESLPAEPSAGPAPSIEQRRCLDAVLEAVGARRYQPFLLHGVTGSGKTEVYFRAVEAAVAGGRSALILVPEIALTPLLMRAATGRFGRTVAVLHSELSAGERHDQWWRIREGEARVVVGARSAVFAPLPDLGLVVVDEEHEAAYTQEESPRYHGRDVAVVRAKLEGAPVVLGSATPSLESFENARKGKYALLALPSRIGARGLPRVEIVDRREALKAGSDPILTPPLREALAACLARREQALMLLNRRGWATSLLCRECGQQAGCPHCSVFLTLHQRGRVALCHYCGYQVPAPRACAICRGEYLRLTGFGTERVVEAVREASPEARVDRLDRDRASRRRAVQEVLTAFEAGAIDVLVGTQMIAKGHDFPRVTLVGVVDADVGLGLPDFRSAERTFQLLTQVAGRAGRADLPGEVILQSHLPDHYALRLACEQDYAGFAEREMEFRRTMGYPPVTALLNLVLRARDAARGAADAEAVARRLRELAGGRFRVLGPARAPLARLRQEHRFQILMKGDRRSMRDAARGALDERFGGTRWPGVAADVDPVTVM